MRAWVRGLASRVVEHAVQRQSLEEKTSPATKAALRALYTAWRARALDGARLPRPDETGLRVFSQFEEDGMLLFLLAVIGIESATYLDLGGGDGVYASNTANLALNFGFHGVVVDGNDDAIARGRRFFANHPDSALYPPRFARAMLTRENVNAVVKAEGLQGDIDVLSIDIDGNDCWIWDALNVVRSRIVVIEVHPELGTEPILVPYDPAFDARTARPHFVGASPGAAIVIGRKLGYRLVAANRYGFNLFFVREELCGDRAPEMPLEALFRHRRARERVVPSGELQQLPFARVP